MNRQGNTYTIIYSAILVIVVGVTLSVVYQLLRPAQEDNIANDTRRQILAAARIVPTEDESIAELYNTHITSSFLVDIDGKKLDSPDNPFNVKVSEQVKLPADKRKLPVFECSTENGVKYIIPVYGAGLWGPIWGYVAFDNNGDTIYGAYFAHQGETPGLGAEIEKPTFSNQFEGKNVFATDGQFKSIGVAKAGQAPVGQAYVNAISGGTITSQGVQKMLENSLEPYVGFLKRLGTDPTEF